MSSEKEQIKNTINEVQEVVDLFYQQNDKDAFDKFLIVLEDMTKAIDNLAIYKILIQDLQWMIKKYLVY